MKFRVSGWAIAILLASTLLGAAERPPRNLHEVDGHWTAWNPPVPPEGAQVHVIERGDTLWDLAARFYGDPYLWPQLWERNQYILDAHWIYPGDPLELGPQVVPADNLAATDGMGDDGGDGGDLGEGEPPVSEPIDGVLTAGAVAGAPAALGSESDIYCSGYVGDLDETFPYSVMGSEYDVLSPRLEFQAGAGLRTQGTYGPIGTVKFGLSTGDIIYVDGGRTQGLAAGSLFTIVQPEKPVIHPLRKGEVYGRYYRYLGRIRILSTQEETSIAEIVHACDPIVVGARLTPFQAEPVPLGRLTSLRPANYPTEREKLADAPVILYARDNLVTLGEDHVVFIDRGADADVTPGDVYTIYRANRGGLPPVVLGELAVLSVHPHSSVAKIVRSRYSIYVGDRLEAK